MANEKPRQIAARVLRQRQTREEFVENLLEKALIAVRLSSVDRALCQELVYGVVRQQTALDWLISRKTKGRVQKPGLQNLLRLGLYQIFWLDRIPAHAAVNETVEMAKQDGFGAQAGFVNAVLRGYLREIEETRRLLVDLKSKEPAIGCSHPAWLVARWQKRWDDEKVRQLLEWDNTPPKTFGRVNTLKTDAGKLLAQWRDENVEYDFIRRDWFEENLVFELKSPPPLAGLRSFLEGWFYIQDPSTLLAVRELGPRPDERILDFCAAPGGKATFMAQVMQDRGKVIARDVSEERVELIRENCERLGATSVMPVLGSNPDEAKCNQQPKISDQEFDKVLVDTPCSNTGVMRRRVDLRWRIQPEEIERLRTTQLDLLRQAAALVKPGGVLVYSTCSLEPEENGEVVGRFLEKHANFKLEGQRELLPFADGVDGAYVARLSAAS